MDSRGDKVPSVTNNNNILTSVKKLRKFHILNLTLDKRMPSLCT